MAFSVLFKLAVNMIKGKKDEHGTTVFSQQIKAEELAFLEKEDGVASLQIIGKGGCGEVYKTELPEGKVKTIAIKKIDLLSEDAAESTEEGTKLLNKKIDQLSKDAAELTEEDTKLLNKKMRQIKSEIQTVGEIRHKNLLPLLAHVSRPNCHYLVYEFMKNGSLQDILQQVKEGRREFDWLGRYKVALGVASGLEYLHMHHTPRIVHRDLKPANVLLDDDMEARIADFGLAESIPEADTHMTSSKIAGSLGYISPEHYETMIFSDKCDIYSFGVVLTCLVTGKFPSDEFFRRSEFSLRKWMRNVMTSENPKQAIDPKMLGNGYEEQMLSVLRIACFCTLDNPKERPNSKDARLMLALTIRPSSSSDPKIPRNLVERDRYCAHESLVAAYFSENPTYDEEIFCARFRMSRTLFTHIVRDIIDHDPYFLQTGDCSGGVCITPLLKCTSAIRQLAYDTAPDALDEYLQMDAKTSCDSLEAFCKGIMELYGNEFLRQPTYTDMEKLYDFHELKHGFPGMIGTIDCMSCSWGNCPNALCAQYCKCDHGSDPFILLEAIASQDLWIWHAFFGVSEANNDVKIIRQSPLFNDLKSGKAPEVPFLANDVAYKRGYYLCDRTYPEWSILMKSISQPESNDTKQIRYNNAHEAARKDVKRAFGVLKKKWAKIRHPSRPMIPSKITDMMYTCIILHNMILKEKGVAISPDFYPEEQHRDYDSLRTHEETLEVFERYTTKQLI